MEIVAPSDPCTPLPIDVKINVTSTVLRDHDYQWERTCAEFLMQKGWGSVPNWECLHMHQKNDMFVSVCMNDMKMAGEKASLKRRK